MQVTVDEALTRADRLVAAGDLAGAASLYRSIHEQAPGRVEALVGLATVEAKLGHRHRATKLLEQAVALKPTDASLHAALGDRRVELGDHPGALPHYTKAIELEPTRGAAYSGLARSFLEQRRFRDAESFARRGLAFDASLTELRLTLGRALAAQGRMADAAATLRQVVAEQPDAAFAYLHLGAALEDPAESAAAYRHALELDPSLAPLHRMIGEATLHDGDPDAAIASLRRAVERVPGDADAWALLGIATVRTGDRAEAIRCLDRALALDSKQIAALAQRIDLLQMDGAFDAAGAMFNRLVASLPDRLEREMTWQTLAAVLYLDAHRPLPQVLAGEVARRLDGVLAGRVQAFGALPPTTRAAGATMRLGYLSAHFGDHPIGHVTASLFETHDRALVEVHGFSRRDRAGERQPFARRLRAGFDKFHDLSRLSPRAAAMAIRDAEIDILIDLDGYTGLDNPEVLAYRPAPLQVSMIGHLNGPNLSSIDYLITDRIVVPPGEEARHREQIVWLPHTLHCADRHPIAVPPSRARCGLPANGTVLGGFARPDKLDAAIVDCWFRILAAADGSVLWLSAPPAGAGFAAALQARAAERGIDPARLVFADRLADKAAHLARYACCDLLLDTAVFNAATTALDALWAGVPVLALKGEREYSRISASLLGAFGMPELICASLADYEQRAIALARAPAALAALRATVAERRLTTPLFDIVAYTRALEAAFAHMWVRRVAGEPPRGFGLDPAPVETVSLEPPAKPRAPAKPPKAPAPKHGAAAAKPKSSKPKSKPKPSRQR
jgi:tetratricopeptide (TPR) repeat protein